MIPAKKLFQSIAGELEEVDVEGWRAFALHATIEPIQNSEASDLVRLLPLFDAYTVGLGRDVEPLLPQAYKRRVFRPQGWISAVVLVGGAIKGVWRTKARRSQTAVTVGMFAAPTAAVRRGIEAEAERLGAFLNTQVVLAYE